jgi:hypothetical protein
MNEVKGRTVMGLLNELGVKPGEVCMEDVEKKLAGGDLPPEGLHHAVLRTVGGIPGCEGRGWLLTFEILAGPGKGMTVEERLWKPKGENEKKDATARNRILLFGSRLGLFVKVKGTDGKETVAEAPGKHELCDCLGATCFIEVQHVEEEYEKNGTKKKITKGQLTFNGIFSAEDKKVKEANPPVPKASSTAAQQAVAAATAGAGSAKKDTFGDL